MTKYKDSLGTYLHLTRKELQKLCKFHKLPANKSQSDLAKSLAFFFKEKNSRLEIGVDIASQGTCSEIENLDERENAEIRRENKSPSKILIESSPEEIDTNATIDGIINLQSSDSEPNPKDQTIKSQSLTKTLDSVPKLGLEKPVTFQFSVYSEEGINIYIDLNSNPSEWIDDSKEENFINPINSCSSALSENNNDININNNNEILEVPLNIVDLGSRADLSVSCQNDEKLKREKVMIEKIDPSTEEQSVIVLDSSRDE